MESAPNRFTASITGRAKSNIAILEVETLHKTSVQRTFGSNRELGEDELD